MQLSEKLRTRGKTMMKKIMVSIFLSFTFIAQLSASKKFFPEIIKELNQSNYTLNAVLTGTGNSGGALQGTDLALSADGTTLAIGSRIKTDEDTGAVWIFVQSNGNWTQQQCITASDEQGAGGFGAAVALSSDGNALAVGGPLDNPASHSDKGIGAVWIYQRNGNEWTEQQKIIPTDFIGDAMFGRSVSLSPDGTTLAAGGFSDNNYQGAVWIYVLNDQTWTEQQKIVEASSLNFGFSVILQANSLLTVSAPAYYPLNSTMPGTVWFFEQSDGQWGETYLVKGPVGEEFGIGLTLSNDTLIVGSPLSKNGTGEARIYTFSNNVWNEVQKLHGTDTIGASQFGYSAAVSEDSTTIVVGGPADNSDAGASWIFKKMGALWIELQKISSQSTGSLMGLSLASSADGTLVAIGQPYINATGQTLLYTNSENAK